MSSNNAWNSTVNNQNIILNSGAGGTVTISGDAQSSTLNLGTTGTKTIEIGSTNTTSGLSLKCGTGDFTLASASGNIMTALDGGSVTAPLQPAFHAYLSGALNNVTGDATVYNIVWDSTRFNAGADYSTVTGFFTASVPGVYLFILSLKLTALEAAHVLDFWIITTPINQVVLLEHVGNIRSPTDEYNISRAFIVTLAAGDTANARIRGSAGTKAIDISNTYSYFAGFLM